MRKPVLAIALALTVGIAGATMRAQSPTAKPYVAAKTADGQPDISGFWSSSTYVPLERPKGVTKEFYTEAEAAAARKVAADRDAEQTTPGTTADVHYDFTQFGLDRSQSDFSRSLRTALIIDPPTGMMPVVNAAGQKRAQERAAARKTIGGQYDRVENMPIGSRCIIMGGAGPPIMNAGYNSNVQIVQSKDSVMILTEMIHDVRVIPLDNRPAPPPTVTGWMGISRGRWEGNTLVVETTNFNGKNPFRGSSEQLKVTERFTRTSPTEINYQFTIEDPQTWDRPWTAEAPLTLTKGPIFEFACHESNYGVANILAGAREDEKKAAAAAAKKATGSN